MTDYRKSDYLVSLGLLRVLSLSTMAIENYSNRKKIIVNQEQTDISTELKTHEVKKEGGTVCCECHDNAYIWCFI